MELNFCCPICSAKSYSRIKTQYVTNVFGGSGSHGYISYYVCDGCSAMFYDPIMFSKKVKPKKEKSVEVEEETPEVSKEYIQNAIENDMLTIYTDGSFRGTTKQSGWGFIVYDSQNVNIHSESGSDIYEGGEIHWNIGAECTAAIKAMEWANTVGLKEATICYDYEGVGKWINGEWQPGKTFTKWYLKKFNELAADMKISLRWVKGHAKDAKNNAVDKIAGIASK